MAAMKNLCWALCVPFYLACEAVAFAGFGFGEGGPLYSAKDKHITLLESSNFTQNVLKSDTAWMVKFYSSWCGHCIRFAPIYKDLSKQVGSTSSQVKHGKFSNCI